MASRKNSTYDKKKVDPYLIDKDTALLTEKDFKSAMTIDEFETVTGVKLPGRRGRPKSENPRLAISIRLDQNVIAYFKKDGKGWQTRINDALREVAGLGS